MTSLILAKSNKSNRGKDAEKLVAKFLEEWASCSPKRSYERLIDAKAAGRTIKASAADFCCWSFTPLGHYTVFLEVKETIHQYRLSREKVPQLPRLRKLATCGCTCLILIRHSTLNVWRVVKADELAIDVPSWDFSDKPTYPTPGAALQAVKVGVFK